MELLTMIAVGAGVGLLLWHRSRKRSMGRHIAEMWMLRFHPLSDSAFVDFKEMLYVVETSYVDYFADYHATRVYNMRRHDGPIWEIREEWKSHRREEARLEKASPRDPSTRLLRQKLVEDQEWGEVEFGAVLEVAYQRFLLHYREIPGLNETPVDLAVARDVNHWASQTSASPKARARRER